METPRAFFLPFLTASFPQKAVVGGCQVEKNSESCRPGGLTPLATLYPQEQASGKLPSAGNIMRDTVPLALISVHLQDGSPKEEIHVI